MIGFNLNIELWSLGSIYRKSSRNKIEPLCQGQTHSENHGCNLFENLAFWFPQNVRASEGWEHIHIKKWFLITLTGGFWGWGDIQQLLLGFIWRACPISRMHDEFNINRGIPVHFEPAPPLTQRPDSCVGIFQFQSFHVLFKGLIVKDHTNMLLDKIYYYSFVAMNVV